MGFGGNYCGDNLQVEIEMLRAEHEALKRGQRGDGVTLNVSEKGAVCLGRFHVTFYTEQWENLLSIATQSECHRIQAS